ncbi:MAG: hypothetical protein OXC48_08390 [Endozoicomonadaceae bacterium]|nr:hypothetical protein [Endozoicomonadaceae bacterium]
MRAIPDDLVNHSTENLQAVMSMVLWQMGNSPGCLRAGSSSEK